MRIGSQGEMSMSTVKAVANVKAEAPKVEVISKAPTESTDKIQIQPVKSQLAPEEQKDVVSKDKLEEAVQSINEFLNTQHKASKFVFHDGLDKYYVQLVDADTDEVIKEIPPERLLNAFYEMKKLAGMMVDEKI